MTKKDLRHWLNKRVFSPKEFYVEVLGDGTIWIVVDNHVICEGIIELKTTKGLTKLA